jgi:hypothetical protein
MAHGVADPPPNRFSPFDASRRKAVDDARQRKIEDGFALGNWQWMAFFMWLAGVVGYKQPTLFMSLVRWWYQIRLVCKIHPSDSLVPCLNPPVVKNVFKERLKIHRLRGFSLTRAKHDPLTLGRR